MLQYARWIVDVLSRQLFSRLFTLPHPLCYSPRSTNSTFSLTSCAGATPNSTLQMNLRALFVRASKGCPLFVVCRNALTGNPGACKTEFFCIIWAIASIGLHLRWLISLQLLRRQEVGVITQTVIVVQPQTKLDDPVNAPSDLRRPIPHCSPTWEGTCRKEAKSNPSPLCQSCLPTLSFSPTLS